MSAILSCLIEVGLAGGFAITENVFEDWDLTGKFFTTAVHSFI